MGGGGGRNYRDAGYLKNRNGILVIQTTGINGIKVRFLEIRNTNGASNISTAILSQFGRYPNRGYVS